MTKIGFRSQNDQSPFTTLVDNLLAIDCDALYIASGFYKSSMANWLAQRLRHGWAGAGKEINLIDGHWQIRSKDSEAVVEANEDWLNEFREFVNKLRASDLGCPIEVRAYVALKYNWHAKIVLGYSRALNRTNALIIGSTNHTWSAIGEEAQPTNFWNYEADTLIWADEAFNGLPELLTMQNGIIAVHADNGKISPQASMDDTKRVLDTLISNATKSL